MGLYREIMYSNAPILKHNNDFFNEYKEFIGLEKPSPEAIKNFQQQKLNFFQKEAFKDNQKVERLNTFLGLNGNLATSTQEFDKIIYESMNNLFSQIDQLIKGGYVSRSKRSKLSENEELEKELVTKLKKIGNSLQRLRDQGKMIVSSSYINQLDNIITSLPNGNVDVVLRTLFHLKGDILEEVGTEWFNQKIPQDLNVKAFSTGMIRGKRGQLIQDLLIVDMDNIDLLNTIISFKVGDNNQSLPLKEFLNWIEKNKDVKSISIELEGEELLQQISLLGIQAKSGINQLPWNTASKNTWVSIQGDDKELDIYLKFLNHINNLKQTWDINNKNIKKESQAYRAIADYELSKSLSKVLHLSKMANQYVLTPKGFVPFVSRILELYEKRGGKKYYFSFGGKIQIDGAKDVLTKMRPVIFSGN